MRLKPYHNPENVDESKVPDGWRFRYADEMGRHASNPCRAWWNYGGKFGQDRRFRGNSPTLTYIVPVAP